MSAAAKTSVLSPAAAPAPLELPDGARLLVETDRLASTVAMAAFVVVGAADEPQPGVRHLLERWLLDKETPGGAQAARLRSHGSDVVSFTTLDYTVYQVVTPRRLFFTGLEFLRQILDPSSPPDEMSEEALSRQRESVLSELVAARSDAEPLRRLLAGVYPQKPQTDSLPHLHPYERPLLGSKDSLSRLHGADLVAFYRRYYRPERLIWVVVGDVTAQEVTAQLQAALKPPPPKIGKGPAGKALLPPAKEIGRRLAKADELPGPKEVLLGFPIPAASSADMPALEIGTALLAGDDESRRSFLLKGREPGAFVVAINGSAEEGVRSAVAAALRLGQREVTAAELSRARQSVLAKGVLRSETPAGRVQRLGALLVQGVDEATYQASLLALTPKDVRATLGRYLTADKLTLAGGQSALPGKEGAGWERLRAAVAEGAATASHELGAGTARTAGEDRAGSARLYRLESGARVAILPDDHIKLAALAAIWPGGQRLEEERNAGLHELLAQVFSQEGGGAAPLPPNPPSRSDVPLRPPVASSIEAMVEPDSFGVRLEFLSADLSRNLAFLRERLEHPSFIDADVERGRRDLLLRLGARENAAVRQELTASRAAWRLFTRSLLGGHHPYALAATESSLTGLTRQRLLDFYHRHYVRSRLFLVVVGDVEPSALLAELRPWLGTATPLSLPGRERSSVPKTAETAERPRDPPPALPAQALLSLPTQQAHLVLGFPVPGAGDKQRAALEVLLELLAGEEGTLRQALLSRRGLAYSLDGLLSGGLLPGYLAFYLVAAPGQLESACATLRDELHKFVDHPVSLDAVTAARERLLGRRALSEQRRSDRAWRLARAATWELPDRALAGADGSKGCDEQDELLAVDAAAVQAAAQKVLQDERMMQAAVLPALPRR